MITIDGSEGEGGGQILRTSLALSLITGQPIRMEKIRAGRKKPGLLNQHLTAVNAAKTISGAEVSGAELGSQTLEFRPGNVTPGNYRFAVGTAGSATLVLQTILPPLLQATGPSDLTLEGGTHNPAAPPFDFLSRCFVPVIEQMGPRIDLELRRPGFFPAGGGNFRARIKPDQHLRGIKLLNRGNIQRRRARAMISKLSPQIAERELSVARRVLEWEPSECVIESITTSPGPGNALLLELEAEHVTAIFIGFGERGLTAEDVARRTVVAAKSWLAADVPVDEHLADQLLLPMALAGSGTFRTVKPSLHSTTNAMVIQRFLAVSIQFEQENELAWRVIVNSK
jgi:RNA 3'-terminal phosphate cyclase (ATP)